MNVHHKIIMLKSLCPYGTNTQSMNICAIIHTKTGKTV